MTIVCDQCGEPATLVGHAFPAGGSYPVATCAECEDLLRHVFHAPGELLLVPVDRDADRPSHE